MRKDYIDKTIHHKLSQGQAYDLFATSQGLKTIMGEDNWIEMKPMGAYEIYFLMDNPYGARGSEGCKVLSFIPGEMISFTWNAPPQYMALRNSGYHTWVVIDFYQDTIRLRHLGWPDDSAWLPVYKYFDRAWDLVLNRVIQEK